MHQTTLAPGYEGFFQRELKPNPQPKKPKSITMNKTDRALFTPIRNAVAIAQATAPAPRVKRQPFDIDDATIVDDPYVKPVTGVVGRYEPKFLKMKLGQGLRMPSRDVSRMRDAMHKFIRRKGMDAHVKSLMVYTYPDGRVDEGYGRVWLMAGPQSENAKRPGHTSKKAAK